MFTRFRKKQRLSPGVYRGQHQSDNKAFEARMRRLVLVSAFALLVVLITNRLTAASNTEHISLEGVIAKQTIIADIGFKSEDIEKTREAREAAAAKVPDVFSVDDAKVARQLTELDEMIAAVQAQREPLEQAVLQAMKAAGENQSPALVVSRAVRTYADGLVQQDDKFRGVKPEALATWLTPKLEPLLPPASGDKAAASEGAQSEAAPGATSPPVPKLEFAYLDDLSRLARSGLGYVLSYGVLKEGERGSEFSNAPQRRILVQRNRPVPGQYAEEELQITQALNSETALSELRSRIGRAAQELPISSLLQVDRIALQDAAYELARLYVTDTLEYDNRETLMMRDAARLAVAPVMKEVMPTEEIQRQGQRWTPQSRMDAQTYLEEKARFEQQTANVAGALAGNMLVVGLLLVALVRALPWLAPTRDHPFRDLSLVLLVVCAAVMLGRVSLYVNEKGLVVPVAAGAIVLAILTNARLAGFASALMAILISVQFDYSWQVLVISSSMSFAGVLSIYKVRKRSDMGSAAVKATLVGILVMVGVSLAQDSLFTESTLNSLLLIALNGVLCLLTVPAILPALERLFGITTDIALLEYSDLNNPILSRLAMEVPATYAHSLMLGQLAEAAADAIGANGLMARVCAYYHDVGKMRRPEYFVENQTGANIHDGMSPRLSARAIASHVTEGAEMARELHLPQPLIDAILEHHGTCLISFFYKEAVAQTKHGGVIEADFRYPGPRPRSRETAILMICDAVESAVRTLKNPNEERVRELIDRIIASRAADRQFDECDLTLRDLDTIAEVLTRRITSTQHRRIAYPDEKPEARVANVIAMPGGPEK